MPKRDPAGAAPAMHPASFRDPCGHLVEHDGRLLRLVTPAGAADADLLWQSGLYDALAKRDLVVPHSRLDAGAITAAGLDAARVLEPQRVPFVSYPYEWCFQQLQDAALLTLDVMDAALDHGMRLKDASAYNVQFIGGQARFIDILSFEADTGGPWVAYGQFLRHFLAPLALAAYVDVRLLDLLRSHLDGIPVDLAARLLPRRTRGPGGLLLHLHMVAAAERRHAKRRHGDRDATDQKARAATMSQNALRGLLASLRKTIARLRWDPAGTVWADYGDATPTYSDAAQADKQAALRTWLADGDPDAMVWDLGANTGDYSDLARQAGAGTVVSLEGDAGAASRHYAATRGDPDAPLALRMDLLDPSPGGGFAHTERDSLAARGPADRVMALALVHHLAITGHVPLERLATWLTSLGDDIIIEWVGPDDPQAAAMLRNRSGPALAYDAAAFEAAFAAVATLADKHAIHDSTRVLYRWTCRRDSA